MIPTPQPPEHYYYGLGRITTAYAICEAQVARIVCACRGESTAVDGAWRTYADGPGKLRKALAELLNERVDPLRAEVDQAATRHYGLGAERNRLAHAVIYLDPTMAGNWGITSPKDGDRTMPTAEELAEVFSRMTRAADELGRQVARVLTIVSTTGLCMAPTGP